MPETEDAVSWVGTTGPRFVERAAHRHWLLGQAQRLVRFLRTKALQSVRRLLPARRCRPGRCRPSRPRRGTPDPRHHPHGALFRHRPHAGPPRRRPHRRSRHGLPVEGPSRRQARRLFLGRRRRAADQRHQAGLRPRLRAARRFVCQGRRPSRCRPAARRRHRGAADALLGQGVPARRPRNMPPTGSRSATIAARTPTCT